MNRGKVTKITSKNVSYDEPLAKQPKIINKLTELSIPKINSDAGQVLSCGTGDVGQLGLGESTMEKTRPAIINSLNNVVEVCAGGMHSLCLTVDGEVITFGCNDEGALGRETSNDSELEFTPIKIKLPGKVVKISAGDSHSACLLENGRVLAWGSFRGSNGNMGLTLEGNKRFPIEVLPNLIVVDIASGSDHLVMLTSSGIVYTIGCGEQGQLGRITQRSSSGKSRRGKNELLQPGIVYKKAEKLLGDKIWATAYCTFVRKINTEKVYGFGLNNYNQLGLEKSGDPQYVPKLTKFQNVKSIAGGQHHTIALNKDNKIYVLGRKEYGRLGIGKIENDVEELTLLKSLENVNIKAVTCGDVCSFALTENDEVYSWGMGSNHQLGLGSEDDHDLPQLITGAQVKNKHVVNISSGGQHTLFIIKEKVMNGSATGDAKLTGKIVSVKSVPEKGQKIIEETIQSGEVTSTNRGRK